MSAVPFLRGMRICDLEVLKDISHSFTTDVSFFRPYAETKNNGSDRKVCITWLQFRSWLTPWGANYCFCLFIYLFIFCANYKLLVSLLLTVLVEISC